MSRSIHAHYTADERAERRARRAPRHLRRQSTRSAVVALALAEA